MKEKVAIITIVGCNYGNRLQNYAVQKILENKNMNAITISNNQFLNTNNYCFKNNVKYFLSIIKNEIARNGAYRINNYFLINKRAKSFIKFNKKNIKFSSKKFSFNRKMDYDYYIVGSDQVWNPHFGLSDFGLLNYVKEDNKKIAFSASIGTETIPNDLKQRFCKSINKFKKISMREDKGKEIIEKLTNRKDIELLVDPTMLLDSNEWDKISKKPNHYELIKNKKFILNYFLGKLSEQRKKEIQRIANENDCIVINILDKNDPFYNSGPSEFLFLEKHAFFICTDSFHSSVFAILYNRPFLVFDREDKEEKMSSRIDTLLNKFSLNDRKYNGISITKENLKHNYSKAYKILDIERKKSDDFLNKALNK